MDYSQYTDEDKKFLLDNGDRLLRIFNTFHDRCATDLTRCATKMAIFALESLFEVIKIEKKVN